MIKQKKNEGCLSKIEGGWGGTKGDAAYIRVQAGHDKRCVSKSSVVRMCEYVRVSWESWIQLIPRAYVAPLWLSILLQFFLSVLVFFFLAALAYVQPYSHIRTQRNERERTPIR